MTVGQRSFREGVVGQGVDLEGMSVEALDGRAGKVQGVIQEADGTFLVVDTGMWILGKTVQVPAGMVSRVDVAEGTVFVACDKSQIKDMPEHVEADVEDAGAGDALVAGPDSPPLPDTTPDAGQGPSRFAPLGSSSAGAETSEVPPLDLPPRASEDDATPGERETQDTFTGSESPVSSETPAPPEAMSDLSAPVRSWPSGEYQPETPKPPAPIEETRSPETPQSSPSAETRSPETPQSSPSAETRSPEKPQSSSPSAETRSPEKPQSSSPSAETRSPETPKSSSASTGTRSSGTKRSQRKSGTRTEQKTRKTGTTDLPIARYDSLTAAEVIARLPDLTQQELGKVERYERRNGERQTVLSRIESLREDQPWRGYDGQNVDEIKKKLARADEDKVRAVRDYERRHRDRAGVMDAARRKLTSD